MITQYPEPKKETNETSLQPGQTWTEPFTNMEFVWVPAGSFEMGDLFGEGHDDEQPVHMVDLDGFWLGKYPVTQAQWEKVMGNNSSRFKGPNNPVEQVSWDDCQDFIRTLHTRSPASGFRLPTEAEWEYAARSCGKKLRYPWGNELGVANANCDGCGSAWDDKSTSPVGSFKPNGLGLYDMSGNVWEWCQDWYDENYYAQSPRRNPTGPGGGSNRVNRGGSWYSNPWFVRTAYRYTDYPDYRDDHLGFRLLRTPIITEYPEPKTETDQTSVQPDQSWNDPVTGMEFVWVEGGSFLMGSPEDDGDAYSDEHPVHEVEVDGFWLGKYPVTQSEWAKVMRSNPSYFKGHRRPMENVDWEDCQEYIGRLNDLGEARFRLPTEAEWEYAARGGVKSRGYRYAGSNDVDEVAWYKDNSDGRTHEVGGKLPNELGLYDMSGNVQEWCEDLYDDEYYASSPRRNPLCNNDALCLRVLRGGSWYNYAGFCRSACRKWGSPGVRFSELGVRWGSPGDRYMWIGVRLVRLPQN
jgi:formylglycine-generating enzyme required for sulfatase activity